MPTSDDDVQSGISDLVRAIEVIAHDGDLATRVPVSESDPDVARLAHAFNESLERVEVMYRALESVVVKQRRFVADASHELRTPLTTVSSCLEMVQHFPDMPSEQRDVVLADALHEAQQMGRLVDDLLTLASMDSGERLRRETVDWDELLATAFSEARTTLAPRTVTTAIAEPLGSGVGDPRAIAELLRLVVSNAAKHTPPETTVAIEARRDGADVVIAVSDDGPGVPAAMIDRIFERFVRVDPARHGEATGLGLPIARAIAVGHGGTIVARSNTPHGLVMQITLPPLTATPDRRRAPRPRIVNADVAAAAEGNDPDLTARD